MMNMKIAICDDEQQQVTYIKTFVSKWAEKNHINITIYTFDSAESFSAVWSGGEAFDVLLLDIQMSGQNGIELAKQIRKSNTELQIIFITGFADYMSEGYDVSALHYLMKPVKEDKLFEVLDRAAKSLEKAPEFLSLSINRENVTIPLSDIVYIESSLNYIIVNTVKEQYKAKLSLTEIEERLGRGFFRCTRSFIVGFRYVHIISKKEITLTTGVLIPLGRGLYEDINNAFIKYLL